MILSFSFVSSSQNSTCKSIVPSQLKYVELKKFRLSFSTYINIGPGSAQEVTFSSPVFESILTPLLGVFSDQCTSVLISVPLFFVAALAK